MTKPASSIDTWSDWPDDVRFLLRWWNHFDTRRLRFTRQDIPFRCADCDERCESHIYGAAVLDGDKLCDDCLIKRARAENELVAEINRRFAGH